MQLMTVTSPDFTGHRATSASGRRAVSLPNASLQRDQVSFGSSSQKDSVFKRLGAALHLTRSGNEYGPVTDVRMGSMKTVSDSKTVLRTDGLSDCTAFVFLRNFDYRKGIYRDRTMIHLQGSSLDTRLDTRSDAGKEVQRLIDKAAKEPGPHKMALIYGDNTSSETGQWIVNNQPYPSYSSPSPSRHLFLEAAALCGGNAEYLPVGSCSNAVAVTPDGQVYIYYPYAS